jgi:hypothetical protein
MERLLKKYPDTTICRGEAYLIDYSLCNRRTFRQSHFRVVSRVTIDNVLLSPTNSVLPHFM